ncbi:MBOAT family O-acyltransferase [Psychroserpens sp.]|uniref:MBOAT family O-acyltransferase n=1 Tax=Psychroserpens sp. TaxID=2020870 RepID=UPI002B2733D5|nr:MBOAT family O-acyltransferase [Psychroserpens sp.]
MSLAFYSWGESELVLLIVCSAIIDFSSGLIIETGRKKLGLYLSLIFNIGILLYFKYADFTFTNLAAFLSNFNISIEDATRFSDVILPLGISFYTFQTMSYTIDVYRGHVKADRNFINFATYVTLFPQLIAGPIVRYKDVESELKSRKTTVPLFTEGIERFIIGLAKKMLIANNCAFLADGIFNMPTGEMSSFLAFLGVLAYSFQIYFDFSGYSDMAIGLGKMLGFNFPENFNYPYISKSIREFWRRWHMTLSHWFRDYVYISLGGNKKSNLRTYINLFIVFFVTGLWHGASWTFIIWGMIHGLFIIIERIGFDKTLKKLPKIITHLYLLFIVSLSWVFFRSESISDAFIYLKAMFSFNVQTNTEFLYFYCSKETFVVLLLAVLFSTPLHKKINQFIVLQFKNNLNIYHGLRYSCLLFLFIISCIYISIDSYNPFIYFRF